MSVEINMIYGTILVGITCEKFAWLPTANVMRAVAMQRT